MKLSELHERFLSELGSFLPDWKFVARYRQFKRAEASVNWLLHISFVNHSSDFDAVGDVAVEFVSARKCVVVIGAQLGNIAGIGQTRHSVNSPESAIKSAQALLEEFRLVGVPFLRRYSSPTVTASVLRAGGAEARLISSLEHLHAEKASALERLGAA